MNLCKIIIYKFTFTFKVTQAKYAVWYMLAVKLPFFKALYNVLNCLLFFLLIVIINKIHKIDYKATWEIKHPD